MMVKAATCGAFDFESGSARDRNWWARLGVIADRLEVECRVQAERLSYDWAVALLSRPGLAQESYNKISDLAVGSSTRIRRLLMPWLEEPADKKQDVKALRDQWVTIWGDPADPRTQAKIAATVAALDRLDVDPRRKRR